MCYVQLAQCLSQWLSLCLHLESKGACRLHQVVLQSLLPLRRVARQTPHHLHWQMFRPRTSESHAKHAHFADKHMNETRLSAESYSFAVVAMRAIGWGVGQGEAVVNSTGVLA